MQAMRRGIAGGLWLLVVCGAWLAGPRTSAQDAPQLKERIRAAEQRLAQAPENPALMFDLGLLRAAAGDRAGALGLLERIVAARTGIDPEGTAFDRFTDDPAYRALHSRIRRDFSPVLNSAPAFSIPEPDLIPEGIAYDGPSGRFFVGSIHKNKIVAIARDHAVSDFVPASRDGLAAVLGLRADSARGLLWAAAEFRVTSADGSPAARTGVAAYELATGRLARRALVDGEGHLLNDLVVTGGGDVYVTDSDASELYRLPAGAARLERVLDSTRIWRPNGITLAPDQSRAFIAAWPSIVILDLRTWAVTSLRHALDIVTAGVDGLYFHEGSLIAVQNDVHPGRVVGFDLSPDLQTVTRARVLASYDPRFEIPTTGALANGGLYIIANSQLGKLARQGGLAVPVSRLQPTAILRVPLER